jgi:hypothetical protein
VSSQVLDLETGMLRHGGERTAKSCATGKQKSAGYHIQEHRLYRRFAKGSVGTMSPVSIRYSSFTAI